MTVTHQIGEPMADILRPHRTVLTEPPLNNFLSYRAVSCGTEGQGDRFLNVRVSCFLIFVHELLNSGGFAKTNGCAGDYAALFGGEVFDIAGFGEQLKRRFYGRLILAGNT